MWHNVIVVTKTDGVLIASMSMEDTRDSQGSIVAVVMSVDGDLVEVSGSDVISFVYSYGGEMDASSAAMVNKNKQYK